MITCISGIPGSGKNVRATYLAIKHYKKENSFLNKIIRRIKHQPTIVNNVYSSYPIILKRPRLFSKKPPVFSNRVSMFDLIPKNRFLPNALIIIDEVQVVFDSEEHKEFPRAIATFNQFHRHFDIADIYYITQHPSRLMKKLRILSCEFDKINVFFNIPLINIGLMHIVKYFEFDDYGKYHHPKKEAKTYDVKNQYKLFFTRKVFKSYSSKYMSVLNINSPEFNKGTYTTKYLSPNEMNYVFRDKI